MMKMMPLSVASAFYCSTEKRFLPLPPPCDVQRALSRTSFSLSRAPADTPPTVLPTQRTTTYPFGLLPYNAFPPPFHCPSHTFPLAAGRPWCKVPES